MEGGPFPQSPLVEAKRLSSGFFTQCFLIFRFGWSFLDCLFCVPLGTPFLLPHAVLHPAHHHYFPVVQPVAHSSTVIYVRTLVLVS